jgi:prepilin-type N-terminal cleavage/methylation domain-containing protein
MKNNKGFTLIEGLVVIAIIGILVSVVLAAFTDRADAATCGTKWYQDPCSGANDIKTSQEVQKTLTTAVPIPQLATSLERVNISKRAQIFNKEDKISYIYLVSYGKVMAFFTVKGKVSSLNSYMAPTEKLVYGNGDPCTERGTQYPECYVVAAPDIDGAYGDNVNGIFFFTTEGAYVEWKGDYMMSDAPLKLTTTPELVRQVQ